MSLQLGWGGDRSGILYSEKTFLGVTFKLRAKGGEGANHVNVQEEDILGGQTEQWVTSVHHCTLSMLDDQEAKSGVTITIITFTLTIYQEENVQISLQHALDTSQVKVISLLIKSCYMFFKFFLEKELHAVTSIYILLFKHNRAFLLLCPFIQPSFLLVKILPKIFIFF